MRFERIVRLAAPLFAGFALLGCGASEAGHAVKPLTERSAATDFKSLKTKREKIEFIQKSRAPQDVKDQAIADINAGKI